MTLGRVLGVFGAVVGCTVAFVASVAAGALLHLDLPATKRLARDQTNAILADQFRGRIVIENVGRLGPSGISGASARIYDPEGVQVLHVDGANARFEGLAAAKSALLGSGPIHVEVHGVSIDQVDALLDGTPDGRLRIATAFESKYAGPPTAPDANPRGVKVDVPVVSLRHAWVHGAPAGAPPIDAEVALVRANAFVDPRWTRVSLDNVELVTRNLPNRVDPSGTIRAKIALPATKEDGETSLEAWFDGRAAGMVTTLTASMNGDRIDAKVEGRGRALQTILDETAPGEDLVLLVEAHGELPRISAIARAKLGASEVDVDAEVDTSEDTRVRAKVAARNIDLSKVAKTAPQSDLGLDGSVDVRLDADGPHGAFAIDTLTGRVEQHRVPKIRARGSAAAERLDVLVTIDDPMMPTEIDVGLVPYENEKVVTAHARALVPNLRAIPQIGQMAGGRAVVEAEGRVLLQAKTIDARARIEGRDLVVQGNVVGALVAQAQIGGTFDRPVVDAKVDARSINAAGVRADTLDARATIDSPIVRDVDVVMRQADREIHASVERITIGPKLVVRGALLEGLGDPIRADASRDAREIRAKVEAPSIDLAKVALLMGKKDLKGTVAFSGDVRLRGNDAQGEVHLRADGVSVQRIQNAAAALDAKIDGRKVDVALEARLDRTGRIALTTKDLVLGGAPSDPASWRKAKGSVALDAGMDLAKVVDMAPEGALPVSELAGTLTVIGTVRRDTSDSPPEVHLHAHTRGLVVAGAAPVEKDPPRVRAIGVAPWRMRNVEAGLDFDTDAASGHTVASFRATDDRGAIASFEAKADLPYAKILADPAGAKDAVTRVPVAMRIDVPERSLDTMPDVLGLKGVAGDVGASLEVSGTAREPVVHFAATGRKVKTSPRMPETDADVRFDYDGRDKAVLALKAKNEGRDALTLDVDASLRASDVIDGKKEFPWKASAKVVVAQFDLATLPQAAQFRMKGKVSGQVALDGLHEDATASARIALDGLQVGGAKYTKGSISVDAKDGRLDAAVRLEQDDGFADIHASTGLTWGDELAPSLVENEPLDARLRAKAFRAAAIQPFTGGAVHGLDGRIDADATFSLDRASKNLKMDGGVTFREGKMQVEALGEEFRDVRAAVRFEPNGVVKVDDVFLRGVEGELRASAEAKLDGLRLAGAKAKMSIPEGKPLDLAMQGQPIGEVFGEANVDVKTTANGDVNVVVNVPNFAVELPQVLKTGVQQLGEPEHIRVGVYRDDKTFVLLPLDPDDLKRDEPKAPPSSKIAVDIRLGRVLIERKNQARVVLAGNTKIDLADEARITGQIRVTEGWVDVQGKKFTVEKGTVTMTGESPPNPVIVATAAWTAQDNTRVYADFVGPVKTGKVTLRSEPPRPQNEILATVLFGSADGANPTPAQTGKASDGTAKTAVGLGGGYAAQGLNEALDDLGGVEANVRIDTTSSRNPRPELELQLAPKISVKFAHVIGTPPVTEPDRNLATLEWHFAPRWTVATTFGDRGKSLLDAFWVKRY